MRYDACGQRQPVEHVDYYVISDFKSSRQVRVYEQQRDGDAEKYGAAHYERTAASLRVFSLIGPVADERVCDRVPKYSDGRYGSGDCRLYTCLCSQEKREKREEYIISDTFSHGTYAVTEKRACLQFLRRCLLHFLLPPNCFSFVTRGQITSVMRGRNASSSFYFFMLKL